MSLEWKIRVMSYAKESHGMNLGMEPFQEHLGDPHCPKSALGHRCYEMLLNQRLLGNSLKIRGKLYTRFPSPGLKNAIKGWGNLTADTCFTFGNPMYPKFV